MEESIHPCLPSIFSINKTTGDKQIPPLLLLEVDDRNEDGHKSHEGRFTGHDTNQGIIIGKSRISSVS